MKLCVLKSLIDYEPIYKHEDLFFYHIPEQEYKKCILKGIVCTGEYIIAMMSYIYARDVIQGRFILGEDAISKHTPYSYWYARIVLRGRFELGETVISTDGTYSNWYAIQVLKERFLLGEESIKNSIHQEEYEKHFNITL